MDLNELKNAYAEIITSTMYIRLPEIRKLVPKYPTIGIKSSYSNLKKDTIINIKAVIESIANEGNKSSQNLRNIMTQIARIFIIATWDIIVNLKTYPNLKDKKLIQFTRHIRNGVAHDNKFKFDSRVLNKACNTLKLPAKWKDKKIELKHENTIVVPDFIKDGDVYSLICDLQKFVDENKNEKK
ncbi:MAG: hypothetical protein ISS34_03015 [Candidatus Omnitrophica bacterium]|nr:hypothetical protein [Candidatus Omnitrophota bacterium]